MKCSMGKLPTSSMIAFFFQSHTGNSVKLHAEAPPPKVGDAIQKPFPPSKANNQGLSMRLKKLNGIDMSSSSSSSMIMPDLFTLHGGSVVMQILVRCCCFSLAPCNPRSPQVYLEIAAPKIETHTYIRRAELSRPFIDSSVYSTSIIIQ